MSAADQGSIVSIYMNVDSFCILSRPISRKISENYNKINENSELMIFEVLEDFPAAADSSRTARSIGEVRFHIQIDNTSQKTLQNIDFYTFRAKKTKNTKKNSNRNPQTLRDPRSIESIEPSGIPERSSRSSPRGSPIDRVDRALGNLRSIDSSPRGCPIDRVDREFGDPRSIDSSRPSPRGSPNEIEGGSSMRQLIWMILWCPRAVLGGVPS